MTAVALVAVAIASVGVWRILPAEVTASVATTNSAGTGPYSANLTGTVPGRVPDAPTNVSPASRQDSIPVTVPGGVPDAPTNPTLTWRASPPALVAAFTAGAGNGSPIVETQVEFAGTRGSRFVTGSTTGGTLLAGRVSAGGWRARGRHRNANGWGAWSVWSAQAVRPATNPGPMRNFRGEYVGPYGDLPDVWEAKWMWDWPLDFGGYSEVAVDYYITDSGGGDLGWVRCEDLAGGQHCSTKEARSFGIGDYGWVEMRVRARNADGGTGPATQAVRVTKPTN